jgi:putative transposase
VVGGIPHHVMQRGNRRQRTFFNERDFSAYKSIMAQACALHGVSIWAYCLMPNHVHLVAVPGTDANLSRAIGDAHRRYTCRIHEREGWRGYLWQGRFTSYPMDERHLMAATRYIEQNPVRAGLAGEATQWRWSSARAHLQGKDDGLVCVRPLLEIVGDWNSFLTQEVPESDSLRSHSRTGRPLGDQGFIEQCERATGRVLRPRRRGPAPRRVTQGRRGNQIQALPGNGDG